MKFLLALLLLSGGFGLGRGLADEPLAFPTLTTRQGVTYKDVKVTRFDALELRFSHANGVATVPLTDLPEDLQQLFGYDPMNASVVLTARQQERRHDIIQEAHQKSQEAAAQAQSEADVAELKSLRASVLRCHVENIQPIQQSILIDVSPSDKLPVIRRSRSGKYERMELDPQGRPELKEQVVPGKTFALGRRIQILPKSAIIRWDSYISVYLIQNLADQPPLCALDAETALRYRREFAAALKKEREGEVK